MSDPVEWLATPDLEEPLLIAAFGGWGDGADAATGAVRWLISHWQAEKVARVSPNDFFDFTVARPSVRLEGGGQRSLVWPSIDLYQARPAGRQPGALLLYGREPHLRWPDFAGAILEVTRRCGIVRAVTLGAFLGPVLHSAPVPLTGFATGDELKRRLLESGVTLSTYQGQTGIASVLHDAFRTAGLPSISLWAAVPFYLGNVSPNPRATHALVAGLDRLLEFGLDLDRLAQAAAYFDEQMVQRISQNSELTELIRQMSAQSALPGGMPESGPAEAETPKELPSADSIIKDLEEFLRRQSGDNPA